MDNLTLVYGALAAVLVFWAVGAYNRLVRLRADANQAFAVLDAELALQAQLVRRARAICAPDEAGTGAEFWVGLEAAAAQLGASLAHARARPLDPPRVAALEAARDVLATAWDEAERADLHDLEGARLPAGIRAERSEAARAAEAAVRRFDDAVIAYNRAIRQFPAVLIAWLFGLRPGRTMRARDDLGDFPSVGA